MRFLSLLLFISLTCIEFTKAQNFAPVGAKWKLVPTHDRVWQPNYPYYFIEATKDTLIEGRIVSKAEVIEGNTSVTPLVAYLYEEEHRVYFYEDGVFKLLYDFNLTAGDTLYFQVPRTWNVFPEETPGTDSIYNALIEAVDSINVNGVVLRVLHTTLDPEGLEEGYAELGIITERLGSEYGIFGRSGIYHASAIGRILLCYEDPLITYSLGNVACDYVTNRPFAPAGATWYFEDFSDCSNRSFFKIVSDPYPFIPDFRWRQLSVYQGLDEMPGGGIILRNEFDKVYFYNGGEYRLLYDFSLEAGDTMRFHLPFNRSIADFTCYDEFVLSPQYEVLVDSVTFQILDGVELKSLHTSPLGSGENCIDLGIVTERLGSSNGLFGKACTDCTVGCSGHFRCYIDEDINYMASPENCDYTTSTNAFDRYPEITIYPVPSSEVVHIAGLTTQEIQTLTVIDIFGRTFHLPVAQHINLSFLTSGYYILAIETTNGERIVRPVIKS